MNRRRFLASAAYMLSLLGIRKEAGKSEIRRFGSLVDEWRGMVALAGGART